MTAPLSGVRVLALEQAVAMPFCTWMLAELGAEVIKVERPGCGDVLRGWDDAVGGLSTGYVWLTGGKRDIAIDLRNEAGQEIVRRLAGTVDVVVENFAPGVVARWGLDSDRLRAADPRIVYCSLSGFGQTGPYRDVKAYDLTIQGEAGVLLTNGTASEPAKVGLPITDLVGGSTAALGIVAALYARESTGIGTYLDIAMLDSIAPWLGYFPHHAWHRGSEPPRSGMRHQYLTPYGPYPASDGELVNVVVSDAAQWRRFCDVVDRPSWLTDPRFHSITARRDHRAFVDDAVGAVIAERPSGYWLERLAAAGLPHGSVRTISQVLVHPQLQARQMFVSAGSPVGSVPLIRSPLGELARDRTIPSLGEDTESVLTALGYSASSIRDLQSSGVVQ